MPSRNADDVGDAETADRTTVGPVETTDAEIREQAVEHLEEALATTETDEKQFHIREALQLLRIDGPL